MTTISADLSASSKTFQIKTRSPLSGQRRLLSGTVFAETGSDLDLEGDLGDGTFVKLADLAEGAAALLNWHAETFRVTGTGYFIISTDEQVEELD